MGVRTLRAAFGVVLHRGVRSLGQLGRRLDDRAGAPMYRFNYPVAGHDSGRGVPHRAAGAVAVADDPLSGLSGLPVGKTLATCAFIREADNVLFIGPPGVGKSPSRWRSA